jgi:hypothetical protein
MVDRLILAAVFGVVGIQGLFPAAPEPPQPLTASQLQVKAKEKSISGMCDRKPKSQTAKKLCKRWKEQRDA